jgi:hypothetical protein
LIYVGMRIADKVTVFSEVHRLAQERWGNPHPALIPAGGLLGGSALITMAIMTVAITVDGTVAP